MVSRLNSYLILLQHRLFNVDVIVGVVDVDRRRVQLRCRRRRQDLRHPEVRSEPPGQPDGRRVPGSGEFESLLSFSVLLT